MHLVFLNQYYPPDVAPTGVMLEALCRRLVGDGHEVTVICAGGGYAGQPGAVGSAGDTTPATTAGVRVIRVGASRFGRGSFVGKLLDYASFYVGVKWHLLTLRPHPARIIALTTPPYLSLLARLFSKLRGGDHGHWVMDLYPDVMVSHGMLGRGGVGHRALAWLTRLGLGGKRCAAVVTLGPDMAACVSNHTNEKVEWVPLWGNSNHTTVEAADTNGEAAAALALRHQRSWRDDEMVVMYSGNMGLGHSFGEILDAAERLAAEPAQVGQAVRFSFHGGGKRCAEINDFATRCPAARVEQHGYAAAGELAAHLGSADVHLASLIPQWTGTMVPSKLQGIFEAGRPVIFIGDARSSLGRWVDESGGGWVVAPGDPERLIECLAEAADPAERSARGIKAAEFARQYFSRETNARRLAEHFTERGAAALYRRHEHRRSQAIDPRHL